MSESSILGRWNNRLLPSKREKRYMNFTCAGRERVKTLTASFWKEAPVAVVALSYGTVAESHTTTESNLVIVEAF